MMTPEEAAQRRDHLIDMGFLVETPALRAYKTIANLEWEYAVLADGLLLYLDHQTERGTIRQHWGTYGEALYLTERFASWNPQILRRLVSQPEEVQP